MSNAGAKEGGCCPPGSWPALQVDYKPRGTMKDIGKGVQAYVVGSGSRGIIVLPDVFGVESGHSKAICDAFADAGFVAVLPDMFRGGALQPRDPNNPLADIGAWGQVRLPVGAAEGRERGASAVLARPVQAEEQRLDRVGRLLLGLLDALPHVCGQLIARRTVRLRNFVPPVRAGGGVLLQARSAGADRSGHLPATAAAVGRRGRLAERGGRRD
eukprot:ctg_1492.g537